MSSTLKNGTVFTEDCVFKNTDVTFENGIITSVGDTKPGGKVIDCTGCYVLPGLVDIHLHGCIGHDMCDGSAASLKAMAEYLYSRGVTGFCPATMTLPPERLTEILSCAAEYARSAPHKGAARLLGIHLEGPFISTEKCGAQDSSYAQNPSAAKLRDWQKAAGGLIKLVTVAPELSGAEELISELSGEFRFSLGHTVSGYETAMRAFAAGADHVTHLFNAMPPLHHRDTGVIGAAFDTPGCFAELICDGVHLSPSAVRAAFRLFGEDRIVLISDSTEATGMPDGSYTLGGQRIFKTGSRAELSDGTIAGSVSSLYDCLLKAVESGIPLESAVRAATINPCRSVGADDTAGNISPGKAASFLILDRNDLSIKQVI